jgi:competence protein ComEC
LPGRLAPAVSLTTSYAGGYALACGVAGWIAFHGEATTALALAAASMCAGVALWTALRSGSARRASGLSAAAIVACFAFCGLARGAWEGLTTFASATSLQAYDAEISGRAGDPRAGTLAVGKVVGFPRKLADGTRFVFELYAAVRGARRDVWGRDRPRLLVTVRPSADVRYGDLLKIAGRISLPTGPRNPGGFDDSSYLSSMRVHARLSARSTDVRLIDQGRGATVYCRLVCPIRRGLGALIGRRLEGESRALLRGLLLGDRSLVGRDLRESLARAGVIHIMAVSGLHAGLVALIILSGARCAGAGGSTAEALSVAGVWAYCALVGAPPSACRAAAMIAAFVLCRRLQRPSSPFAPLSAAALALVLARPRWVLTPGFQLSFSAAAGVIGFMGLTRTRRARAALARVPGAGYAVSLLVASLGASATTWPIVAYHFGRAPVLFLLGNAVAVPLVGLILTWGLGAALLGALCAALADWLLAACWAASRLLVYACRAVAAAPWASATVVAFSPWLIPAYLAALAACFPARGRVRLVAVACLLVSSALICAGVPKRSGRARLKAAFLDVGHGDACVMMAPGGGTMLIDTGAASESWNAGRDVILPFLGSQGVRRLDRVVISHGDGDHWGGLEEISRGVAVKEIVLARGVPLGDLADLVPALQDRGISVVRAAAGDTLRPLGGLECMVLHPSAAFEDRWASEMGDELNERSLVLRVRYGKCVFLATGDIERRAERWLSARGAPLRCAVLKVPHHGSDTSSCSTFAAKARPLVAVISCGPPERFNLPKPTVTARYDSLGAARMVTARDGAVLVETDGETVIVTPYLRAAEAFRIRSREAP